MPISSADRNSHAYDLKIFQASGRKRFHSRSNAKGGGGSGVSLTTYDNLLPVPELRCHSLVFNPALQCWEICVLSGIHVFCAIVLLSPKGPFQALLCCYCSSSVRMFVSSVDPDSFWGVWDSIRRTCHATSSTFISNSQWLQVLAGTCHHKLLAVWKDHVQLSFQLLVCSALRVCQEFDWSLQKVNCERAYMTWLLVGGRNRVDGPRGPSPLQV